MYGGLAFIFRVFKKIIHQTFLLIYETLLDYLQIYYFICYCSQWLLLLRTKTYSKTTGQGASLGLFNKVTKNFAVRVLHTSSCLLNKSMAPEKLQ